MSEEIGFLTARVNELRYKSLNCMTGLTEEEVREGISLIVRIRRIRAGGKGQNELPEILKEKLSDLF